MSVATPRSTSSERLTSVLQRIEVKQLRLLLAGGVASVCQTLARELEDLGYSLVVAESPADAVHRLHSEPFDVFSLGVADDPFVTIGTITDVRAHPELT